MAKYFSVSQSNREVFFCILCRKKRIVRIEAFEKAKKNFNLYAQFNIEMIGVPMKRDYHVSHWF
jgi:hypothetical protein